MWMNPAGDDVASAESRIWGEGILHLFIQGKHTG